MKQHRLPGLAVLCLALSSTIISCQKEDLSANNAPATEASSPDGVGSIDVPDSDIAMATALASTTATSTTNTAFALPYTLSVNWNGKQNGGYVLPQSTSDFRQVAYWQGTSAQSQTYNGMLRATLLKNTLSSGGVFSKIDIPDASYYRVSFDMQFAPDFDFSRGGKAGFGLLIGNGNMGGVSGADGNGGSFRLAWEKNAAGNIVLRPDVYYKDQPASFGNSFGKQFPATGSLKKGTWYKVVMTVKSNKGTAANGVVQLVVNGSIVLNQAIRWTTNDAKRFINNVCFENFRGGSETSFQSATDGSLLFDNVVIKSLTTEGPAATSVAPTPTP
ncbi:MAG: hypothetical protein EOO11_13520, partial [Chitinophagaceae bacterium]